MNRLKKYHWLLLTGFFVSMSLTIIQLIWSFPDPDEDFAERGNYSADLRDISTIQDFVNVINDQISADGFSKSDTAEVTRVIDSLVRYRFYHGSARRSMNDDYLSAILGKFIWDDLRVVTSPNEILDHRVAVCNQTNIVLQAILAEFDYPYRTIGLNNHQLTEVRYGSDWHIHDCDYEPRFDQYPPPSMKKLLADPQKFRSAYAHVDSLDYNRTFSNFISSSEAIVIQEGGTLGRSMSNLQLVTRLYSLFGWSFWLVILLFSLYLRYRKE